jgi:hypothetical protein
MNELKIVICEALILLFYKNDEVGANLTFFYEAELLKFECLTCYV